MGKKKLEIGKLVATQAALEALQGDTLWVALGRHITGDWGDLEYAEDWEANDRALASGNERVFSIYHSAEGVKFWVITEADRSLTTVLLPEDY